MAYLLPQVFNVFDFDNSFCEKTELLNVTVLYRVNASYEGTIVLGAKLYIFKQDITDARNAMCLDMFFC